jgi:hypothetical protein
VQGVWSEHVQYLLAWISELQCVSVQVAVCANVDFALQLHLREVSPSLSLSLFLSVSALSYEAHHSASVCVLGSAG